MSEARRLATYEDLLRLPEQVVGEIIDGELYASPRPASPHANASSWVGGQLLVAFGGRRRRASGGWVILDEPELHLGSDILVPDIAGWRRSRMPIVPVVRAFSLAPDWVCEVLSPSTTRLDRFKKLPVYATFGVGYVWLVDPLARTLEVFRLADEHWLLVNVYSGDEPVRAEPFEELELDIGEWWIESASEDAGPQTT